MQKEFDDKKKANSKKCIDEIEELKNSNLFFKENKTNWIKTR